MGIVVLLVVSTLTLTPMWQQPSTTTAGCWVSNRFSPTLLVSRIFSAGWSASVRWNGLVWRTLGRRVSALPVSSMTKRSPWWRRIVLTVKPIAGRANRIPLMLFRPLDPPYPMWRPQHRRVGTVGLNR